MRGKNPAGGSTIPPLFLWIAAAVFLFSCAGAPGLSESAEAGLEEKTGKISEPVTPNDVTNVTEKTLEADFSRLMWNTFPREGAPLFFAAATRKLNWEEERQAARVNGAVQAAKYVELNGKAFFLKQKTGQGIGYLQDIQIAYDESLAEKLEKKLEPLGDYRDNRNTYLLLKLASPIPGPDLPVPSGTILRFDDRGKPLWIDTPPKIPGFLTAVGAAQGRFHFADSVAAADEKALEELLMQISANVKTLHEEHTIESAGTLQKTTSLETAEAKITGFYVLSRWTDGRYFYSLAVCNPENP